MRIVDEINQLCSEGNYPEGLKRIKESEQSGQVTAELLVKKAMCLQMLDDSGTLEEIEQTFETALHLDPKSVQALVEFGWFQLNVKDQPRCAESLFDKALAVQVPVNTEIVTGLLRCRMEASSKQDSESLLRELVDSLIDESKVELTVTQ